MPYPNEHSARIMEPSRFEKFRRENDRFDKGIDVIWGIFKDGSIEIQAIRFDIKVFTPEKAKAWLQEQKYSPIKFEEAAEVKAMAQTDGDAKRYSALIGQIKVLDEKNRILGVTISTNDTDRDGDIIEPKGLDFSHYIGTENENPIVLWCHDLNKPAVGKVLKIDVTDSKVYAEVQFADTEFGIELFKLYKGGYMRAWSIGFIPKAADKITEGKRTTGLHITKAEVIELSAVPVGANPKALSDAVKNAKQELIVKALKDQLKKFEEPSPQKTTVIKSTGLQIDSKNWDTTRMVFEFEQKGWSRKAFRKSIKERVAAGKVPVILRTLETDSEIKGIVIHEKEIDYLELDNVACSSKTTGMPVITTVWSDEQFEEMLEGKTITAELIVEPIKDKEEAKIVSVKVNAFKPELIASEDRNNLEPWDTECKSAVLRNVGQSLTESRMKMLELSMLEE